MQALCRIMLITNYEEAQDVIQDIRSDLLLGIAPGIIRRAVALYDQTVEAQVHSLLAERSDEVAATADVARVADDRQLRNAAVQLDRNLPHREIAVDLLVEAGETAVDGTKSLDTSLVDTLERTDPELKIRIHRVLHQHRNIHALKAVSQCLHGEWIGRSTCSHPQNIDSIFQGELHVLRSSYLGSCEHTGLLLHLLHPRQGSLAISLEASWFGTWLPYTSAEHVAAFSSQLLGGSHNLLFSLCRAWACNDDRAFLITREIQWF